MKRFFYTLFAILAFVACSESDVDNGGSSGGGQTPPKQPEITLGTTAADFSTDGGSNVITFTSSVAWTAEVVNTRADDWCSIEPTSGAAGNAKITVTTTANDTPDDRTASIIIKAGTASKTITVSQKQKDALTVTASKFELGAEGGEVAIEVKANIDFEYVIEESAEEWIEYKTTRALKTSNLVFGVKENESEEKREAKITISSGAFSETITIYQAGSEPTIIISQNEYVVSSDGDTIAVEVKSNVDVTVELPTNVDWIAENTTRAFSTNTYYFNIAPSEEYDQRSAEIKFTNKETGIYEYVTVTQMQRDAIVLAKSEYEFGTDGGNLDFEIHTNVDITVTISEDAIDWIQQVETRGLETKALYFNVAACSAEEDREGTITISGGNAKQTITVKQSGLKEILEKEREALIAFYEATGGDNWTNNENWCSDKPLDEWYGIQTNQKNGGNVISIHLSENNLNGTIPEEIGYLTQLYWLALDRNHLTGEIPKSFSNLVNLGFISLISNNLSGKLDVIIDNMTKLEYLWLSENAFSGEIPSSICNLTNLQSLELSTNALTGNIPPEIGNLTQLRDLSLAQNKLTGSIPESLRDLTNLELLWLVDNQLSGEVPESFYDWELWKYSWAICLPGNKFKFEDLTLPGPNAVVECFNGKTIDLEREYPKHKYTILFGWEEGVDRTLMVLPQIKDIYNSYNEDDVKIIGWGHALSTTEEKALEYIQKEDMQWDSFYYDWENDINTLGKKEGIVAYPAGWLASVTVVDNSGKIVFSDEFDYDIYKWDNYLSLLLANDFKGIDLGDIYESTDYSKDGEVKQLQKATKGKGIDVVLMGDAYTDRLIADGTYDRTMNVAMEKFFEKEPYKSFRDHFNVYSVTAVSKHDTFIMGASTALEGFFGGGTHVGGNDGTVFEYGLKAIGEERMDDALFVVMMNSPQYAGTCYMYSPAGGDWGNGIATAYFPVGTDDEALGQLMHHEAAGHGFAKLGDEYQYEGTISAEEIEDARHMGVFGWWKNIDFTSDPTKVKWSYFLSDPRYANEGLGVYEGSFTYSIGAYRPTENSIMRHNTGEFNAPSREAIYYRIHKLAYGADWEYDYEEFVKWDEKNRNKEQTRGIPYRLDIPEDFQPTHPPVVINKSWKDAR